MATHCYVPPTSSICHPFNFFIHLNTAHSRPLLPPFKLVTFTSIHSKEYSPIMTESKLQRIAILPSPGFGHLIPLIELAKRIVSYQKLAVTFIIPSNGPPPQFQTSILESLPSAVTHSFLPPVPLNDFPEGMRAETIISLTMLRSVDHIRSALVSLSESSNLVAIIVDLFGTDAFDVSKELGIDSHIFFTSTATVLSLFLHLPRLDQMVSCEYRELSEPVKLPGCVPFRGRDLLDPVQDRKNDAYRWLLHHAKRFDLADGIMVNSFTSLEPGAFTALQERKFTSPLVYPVGPLVDNGSCGGYKKSRVLEWLDEQPPCSVLYVSFGSGGTLSFDQIQELAAALELSRQRFLWVVRSPNNKSANASFFEINSATNTSDFLPEGFLERTRRLGLVVSGWAPQAHVLRHGSISGFLTHCGWNSTLESLVNGVPLIAWPLYAEQKMNAVMLVEEIGVALRISGCEDDGLFGREQIASVIEDLMEGERGKTVRERMRELKEAAEVALSTGSSARMLSEFASSGPGRAP